MRPWAAPVATKKRLAPKDASFRTATNLANGIRRINALSCGTFSTVEKDPANTSTFSLLVDRDGRVELHPSGEHRFALTLYFAHWRECIRRNGVLLSLNPYMPLRAGEAPQLLKIRFRTCGDMPITGAVESSAEDLDSIYFEIAASRTTKRGEREDDKRSETAMEDRKKVGYF